MSRQVSFFCLNAALLFGISSTPSVLAQPQGKVAFLRSNQIWTALEDGAAVKQLTDTSEQKGPPAWSLDGRRIAFFTTPAAPDVQTLAHIVIIDESGSLVNTIKVMGTSKQNPGDIRYLDSERPVWIGPNSLSYTGNYNPSVAKCRVIDIRTGEIKDGYLGTDFAWSPDRKKLAQLGFYPHFYPEADKSDYVQVNRVTVYGKMGGKESHHIIAGPEWSPDGRFLAFVDTVQNRNGAFLVALSDGKVARTVQLPAVNRIRGPLRWIGENTVTVWDKYVIAMDGPVLVREIEIQKSVSTDRKTLMRESVLSMLRGEKADWWLPQTLQNQ